MVQKEFLNQSQDSHCAMTWVYLRVRKILLANQKATLTSYSTVALQALTNQHTTTNLVLILDFASDSA